MPELLDKVVPSSWEQRNYVEAMAFAKHLIFIAAYEGAFAGIQGWDNVFPAKATDSCQLAKKRFA
jgi:hypothetical protein